LWRSGELLDQLSKDNSPAADEALVVLFSYYLGESNGEDLVDEVIARGNRMLPYLTKCRHRSIEIAGRNYPASMLLPPEVRESFFQEAISSIKKQSKQ
jgi:hypothetical protein